MLPLLYLATCKLSSITIVHGNKSSCCATLFRHKLNKSRISFYVKKCECKFCGDFLFSHEHKKYKRVIGAFYTCFYTIIHLSIACLYGVFMSLIYKFAFLLALGTF